MEKAITGFKTVEDVKETLKKLEAKWFVWSGGDLPTKFNWWENDFWRFQEQWWFYLKYCNEFIYGRLCWDEKKVNFKKIV